MKKKVSIIAAITIVVAVAAYGFFSRGGDQAGNMAAGSQQAMPLQAIKLHPETITTYEALPGRTTAYKVAEIRPQVSGIITERLFKEGGTVKEGDQLYQIDPAPYKAAYDSAVADLKKAEANVKSTKAKNRRYEELVKIDAVSKQEYDDLQASLAQAEADIAIAQAVVSQAKINLGYTKVYAPISGRIGKSTITKGALVTANQESPLATITQLDPIYVDMTQSSTDLMQWRSRIKDYQGIPVTLFISEDKTPYTHKGTLQFHEVLVEQTTGSVQLRALFPNPDEILLPGLFVRAELTLEKPDVLLVPQQATTRQPDGSLSVWVLDGTQSVQSVTITTSGAQDGQWIVASGLKAGDIIITEGLIKLRPGVKVQPILENALANETGQPNLTQNGE